MHIALLWGRFDLVKNSFEVDCKFGAEEINALMKYALVNDKPEFVEYFLDNQINLNDFVRKELENDKQNEEFFILNKVKNLFISVDCAISEKNSAKAICN